MRRNGRQVSAPPIPQQYAEAETQPQTPRARRMTPQPDRRARIQWGAVAAVVAIVVAVSGAVWTLQSQLGQIRREVQATQQMIQVVHPQLFGWQVRGKGE